MLLEVAAAVEAGGAEVAGEGPLARVDDDVSGELRAALFVFAAEAADEGLWRTLSVGVDHLAVALQVADAPEAAAAQVAAEGPGAAVDEGVAGQQRAEAEGLATQRADEGVAARRPPPLARLPCRRLLWDAQVHAQVVLPQTGGALEAAQAHAAAVRLVGRMRAGVSGEQRLRLHTLPTHVAGKGGGGRRHVLAAASAGVQQDLVAAQLVVAGELAAADVTQVRPLACVRLEVDGELRLAAELAAAEVAEQRAGPWRRGGAVHVHHLPVVLQVVGPHVGLGAEVAAVRLQARVDDLVGLQARAAAEGLPADGAQPPLQLAPPPRLGAAVGVHAAQVVLQVVPAVEAQRAQMAGEGLLPRVDEGVASQARLAFHHFPAHVAHRAAALQPQAVKRCTLGSGLHLLLSAARLAAA